uniref:Uncharacterized protein n=1 Tax=Lepeophtheirus salmonis TaxID=72036 RepID=A0A0K2UJX3_LEPSM
MLKNYQLQKCRLRNYIESIKSLFQEYIEKWRPFALSLDVNVVGR